MDPFFPGSTFSGAHGPQLRVPAPYDLAPVSPQALVAGPARPQIREQYRYFDGSRIPPLPMPHPDGSIPPPSAPFTSQTGFMRLNEHPEISARPFDRASTDSIAFVDDSTASVPQSSELPPPPPRPSLPPAKSLPSRRPRRKLKAEIDASVAAHDSFRRFGDVCYEAISAVFPSLTGNQMNDVKEALTFCIPKWLAVIDRPDSETPPDGKYYHEYTYYSDEEDEAD
jgi:hypothetical protein